MQRCNQFLWLVSGFISFMFSSAHAFNLHFMDYSAMSYFSDKDWTILQKTAVNVLNNTKDGVKVKWMNPNTHTWGTLLPSKTSIQNGTKCRNLEIINHANGLSGKSSYRFCKMKSDWRIVH